MFRFAPFSFSTLDVMDSFCAAMSSFLSATGEKTVIKEIAEVDLKYLNLVSLLAVKNYGKKLVS